MTKPHVLFILSIKAGSGRSRRLSRLIEKIYEENGRFDDLTITVTQHGRHAEEAASLFARKHGANGLVFICGGDGSTSEVANALAGSETALGVIPVGTANDFAKKLYSKKEMADVPSLIRRSLQPDIRPIDLIRFNDRYAINIVSLGFDTVVLKEAYRVRHWLPFVGRSAYTLGVLLSLPRQKVFPLHMTWKDPEGREHESAADVILGTICNGSYYGSGFNPAPDARVDDGVLHLGIMRSLPFLELLRLIGPYKKGTHLKSPYFSLNDAVSGCFRPLDSQTQILGNSDGILFTGDELRFEVVPQALRFAHI